MKRIWTNHNVNIAVNIEYKKVTLVLRGSSAKRRAQVANYHLPVKRIEKMMTARGAYYVPQLVDSIKHKEGLMYEFGNETWLVVRIV